MYWRMQQTNLEYLLYLDPNRVTCTFDQGRPEYFGGPVRNTNA
jgi:hypothetical protein